jgi:hypothetical protein
MRPLVITASIPWAALLLFTSVLWPGGVPRAAGFRTSEASPEAAIMRTMRAFRHAVATGDSAAAVAVFTRAAWLLDRTEYPAHPRFVRLAGCRGWCRPSPPLGHYQMSVLPGADTVIVVETYRRDSLISTRRRRVPAPGYTAVSVVVRQREQWLISSQTLSQALAE